MTTTGMGTTLHQKRPSISNWFSSLRRQPKAKKNIDRSGGSFGSKQQLQRSCFDLSSTAATTGNLSPLGGGLPGSRSSSTFYITAPPAGSDGDRHRLLGNAGQGGGGGGGGSSNSSAGSSSTTISSGSSGVCARCFCNLGGVIKRSSPKKDSPKLGIKTGKPPPLQMNPAPRSPRSPSLSPFTSVATYKVTELEAESPPPASPATPQPAGPLPTSHTSPRRPTLSTETVTCSDVSRKVELQRLPCDEPQTQLYNKRCEVTHKTTTTTTRTLIVSRPVELLLNERGEIISKRLPPAPRKTRSNSLGCMLDVVDDNEGDEGYDNPGLEGESERERVEREQAVSPSSLLSSCSPLTPEAGELRFIDDSSNSPSESERNSISQSHNNNSSNIAEHNNNSSKQQNNNCNNNNNNDAQQANLCESCRTLIQRNRNNAELSGSNNSVILRRPQVCEVEQKGYLLSTPHSWLGGYTQDIYELL